MYFDHFFTLKRHLLQKLEQYILIKIIFITFQSFWQYGDTMSKERCWFGSVHFRNFSVFRCLVPAKQCYIDLNMNTLGVAELPIRATRVSYFTFLIPQYTQEDFIFSSVLMWIAFVEYPIFFIVEDLLILSYHITKLRYWNGWKKQFHS